MNEELVDLHCPKCNDLLGQWAFEDLFEDRELHCARCNAAVFWVNCLKCDTGYCTHDRVMPCPGCM